MVNNGITPFLTGQGTRTQKRAIVLSRGVRKDIAASRNFRPFCFLFA